MADDKLLPLNVREQYADWWYDVGNMTDKLLVGPDGLESEWLKEAEDLGDFVEAIRTLLSFGPNPRAFEPQILPREERELMALVAGDFIMAEVVEYDPENLDTYPSVCQTPEEVKARFGFEGGEKLLFTRSGSYIGRVTMEFEGS